MPGTPNDSRPPMVVAMQWVHQIFTVSLEMTLPAGLGCWLDQKWGTSPWLLTCGAVLGFMTAMTHLLQMAKAENARAESKERRTRGRRTKSGE